MWGNTRAAAAAAAAEVTSFYTQDAGFFSLCFRAALSAIVCFNESLSDTATYMCIYTEGFDYRILLF